MILLCTFYIVFALNVLVETNAHPKTELSLPLMTALSTLEMGTSGLLKSQPLDSMSVGLRSCFISPFQRLGIYFELRDEVLNGD